ncbi:MAG: ParB/RepB/Spo0J family partition protein [Gammaproteobacteria bacterium]|nr:ParB/RepB/Spo0J family partition protein [Gammaproteobacteria bacterium]
MTAQIKTVGIEQLRLSPARPQGFVPNPTPALQQRITTHGVIDPLVVRPLDRQHFEILTNPATWVAAGRAGLHELPVTVREGVSDTEAASIVADHYLTASLSPMDEAHAFEDQLHQLGSKTRRGSVTELARRLGLPRSQVAHSLRLLDLPAEIQSLIQRGELSAGQARPLITITGRERQLALADKIVFERLSVRDVERLAREVRESGIAKSVPSGLGRAQPDADVQRLEQRVSDLIGSPFEIRDNEAVFNFFGDFEVLDGLLTRLGYRED